MWISFGDKYEIISFDKRILYDKEKRPRKTISIKWIMGGLCVACFLSFHLFLKFTGPTVYFWKLLPSIIALLSAATSLVLFFLKWKKNDKECDLGLILSFIIFLVVAWLVFLVLCG